jgi:hypothetical protein
MENTRFSAEEQEVWVVERDTWHSRAQEDLHHPDATPGTILVAVPWPGRQVVYANISWMSSLSNVLSWHPANSCRPCLTILQSPHQHHVHALRLWISIYHPSLVLIVIIPGTSEALEGE